jgi:hypothetical protein
VAWGPVRSGLAALAVAACLPARATAQQLEPPSVAEEPLRSTAESLPDPPAVTASLLEPPDGTALDAWIDLPHAFVERRIFDISNGFDRFFADESDLELRRSRSFVRWRSEARMAEDGSLTFGSALRADLSLPNLEKRLRAFRIVLENVGRAVTDPEDTLDSGQQGGRGDAVLRWTLLGTLRSSIDVGAGVLFAVPPGLVARTRFRVARELGHVALARAAAVGFWSTRDRFGFSTSLSFERALGHRLLLRWASGTLVSQRSSSYAGHSELALLATLDSTTAVTLLGSVSGRSKPEPAVAVWRVATRLRTALVRRWIYGEVEPEVRWPLDAAGGRRRVPAIFFRLEFQFEAHPPMQPAFGPV